MTSFDKIDPPFFQRSDHYPDRFVAWKANGDNSVGRVQP